MEDIPRYSYDLIDELDRDTPKVTLPIVASHWHALDENAMRMAAFQAGRRAIVDELVAARTEIEETKADERAGTDIARDFSQDSDYGLGQVLGPDGERHQTVASTHVAARLVGEDHSDSGEASSD